MLKLCPSLDVRLMSYVGYSTCVTSSLVILQVIMEGYDYDAAASTIRVEDIAADETNRKILRKLKENDPEFGTLWICSHECRQEDYDYVPEGASDFGWLGYFIGKCETLKVLGIQSYPNRTNR